MGSLPNGSIPRGSTFLLCEALPAGTTLRQRLDGGGALSVRLAADLFALPVLPHVIPNFIDLTKFQPTPQKKTMRWGRAIDSALYRPIIVHISNFRKVKAISNVGRIFLGIRARLKAGLWLVGDGEDRDELNAFLEYHGLAEDIRFLGLTREVEAILRQAHLLLLHSHYESFCLAALEAMVLSKFNN